MSDPGVNPQTISAELVLPDGVQGPGEGLDRGDDGGIESPAKIIRIGAMVKQLLEEVRSTELDEGARDRLRAVYENSLVELRSALSSELSAELERLALDFSEEKVPSESELRIAKAQLVGWLEGLFHGIQATLVAQQMAARQQLEGMRAQISARPPEGPGGPGYI